MKTVCKKLFSLMLVAALLVSAIPAAFAAGVTCPVCGSSNVTAITGTEWNIEGNCTTDGQDVYKCNTTTCTNVGKWFTVKVPAPGEHDFEDVVETAPDCLNDGVIRPTCKECGATANTKTAPATGHNLDNGTITTQPTCVAEGVKTFKCTNGTCNYTETEPVPVSTVHTFGADGKCTVEGCNETDGVARYTVMFNDEYGTNTAKVFKDGETITIGMLPEGSLKDSKKFVGWYNGSSKLEDLLQNGKWHAGMPTTFNAKYIDSNDDGVSKLYVYVRFYVKGVQQGYTQLLLDPITFQDGENMFNWLQNNKGTIGAAIEAKDTEDKYDWYPEYFYDYSGEEILTAQNMKANGDQSVVVKAFSKDATEAKVLLYVHTSKTSTPAAIYEMNGYTAGNTVTLAAVKTELKNKYTVSAGLYDADDWDDLLNGLSPMASNGIAVQHNGTTEIHVLAKAASSNEDSANPKTGDYITIAATTMVLAAGAFVAMVEMKKRKMI